MPDPAPFDHSRAAAFEERLVGVLNAGALCLMTSLGHRVELFDAMADMPAASLDALRFERIDRHRSRRRIFCCRWHRLRAG